VSALPAAAPVAVDSGTSESDSGPGAVDAEAVRIGGRIRGLRHARGLTLVQLASASGLSHPFLSQLERGLARPSIGSLERIARALSSSQVELLTDDDAACDDPAVVVTRADEGSRGGFAEGEGRLLLPGAGRPFRPIEFVGENTHWGDAYVHAEDEFVHVIEGRVQIELDGTVHELGPRDSAYSMGGTPHRWRSADGRAFRLLIVKEPHR
jgi:transcriptional regulator with XRE-family HTH domain